MSSGRVSAEIVVPITSEENGQNSARIAPSQHDVSSLSESHYAPSVHGSIAGTHTTQPRRSSIVSIAPTDETYRSRANSIKERLTNLSTTESVAGSTSTLKPKNVPISFTAPQPVRAGRQEGAVSRSAVDSGSLGLALHSSAIHNSVPVTLSSTPLKPMAIPSVFQTPATPVRCTHVPVGVIAPISTVPLKSPFREERSVAMHSALMTPPVMGPSIMVGSGGSNGMLSSSNSNNSGVNVAPSSMREVQSTSATSVNTFIGTHNNYNGSSSGNNNTSTGNLSFAYSASSPPVPTQRQPDAPMGHFDAYAELPSRVFNVTSSKASRRARGDLSGSIGHVVANTHLSDTSSGNVLSPVRMSHSSSSILQSPRQNSMNNNITLANSAIAQNPIISHIADRLDVSPSTACGELQSLCSSQADTLQSLDKEKSQLLADQASEKHQNEILLTESSLQMDKQVGLLSNKDAVSVGWVWKHVQYASKTVADSVHKLQCLSKAVDFALVTCKTLISQLKHCDEDKLAEAVALLKQGRLKDSTSMLDDHSNPIVIISKLVQSAKLSFDILKKEPALQFRTDSSDATRIKVKSGRYTNVESIVLSVEQMHIPFLIDTKTAIDRQVRELSACQEGIHTVGAIEVDANNVLQQNEKQIVSALEKRILDQEMELSVLRTINEVKVSGNNVKNDISNSNDNSIATTTTNATITTNASSDNDNNPYEQHIHNIHKQFQQECAQLNEQLTTKDSLYAQLATQMNELIAAHEQLSTEHEKLNNYSTQLNSELEQSNHNFQLTSNRLTQMTELVEESQQALFASERQLQELELLVVQKQDELTTSKQDLQTTQQDVQVVRDKLQSSVGEVALLHAQIASDKESHSGDIALLHVEIARDKESHAREMQQKNELHANEMQQKSEAHASELQQIRLAHEQELLQTRVSHTNDLQQIRISHTKELSEISKEHETVLNSLTSRFEGVIDAKSEEIEALREEIAELDVSVKEKSQRISLLEQEVRMLTVNKDELLAVAQVLRSELDSCKGELSRVQLLHAEYAATSETTVSKLNDEILILEADLHANKDQVHSQSEYIVGLEEQLAAIKIRAEQDLSAAETRLGMEKELAVSKLEAVLSSKDEMLTILQVQSKRDVLELSKKHSEQMASLMNEHKQQMELMFIEHNTKVSGLEFALQTKTEESDAKIEFLNDEVFSLQKENLALSNHVTQLEADKKAQAEHMELVMVEQADAAKDSLERLKRDLLAESDERVLAVNNAYIEKEQLKEAEFASKFTELQEEMELLRGSSNQEVVRVLENCRMQYDRELKLVEREHASALKQVHAEHELHLKSVALDYSRHTMDLRNEWEHDLDAKTKQLQQDLREKQTSGKEDLYMRNNELKKQVEVLHQKQDIMHQEYKDKHTASEQTFQDRLRDMSQLHREAVERDVEKHRAVVHALQIQIAELQKKTDSVPELNARSDASEKKVAGQEKMKVELERRLEASVRECDSSRLLCLDLQTKLQSQEAEQDSVRNELNASRVASGKVTAERVGQQTEMLRLRHELDQTRRRERAQDISLRKAQEEQHQLSSQFGLVEARMVVERDTFEQELLVAQQQNNKLRQGTREAENLVLDLTSANAQLVKEQSATTNHDQAAAPPPPSYLVGSSSISSSNISNAFKQSDVYSSSSNGNMVYTSTRSSKEFDPPTPRYCTHSRDVGTPLPGSTSSAMKRANELLQVHEEQRNGRPTLDSTQDLTSEEPLRFDYTIDSQDWESAKAHAVEIAALKLLSLQRVQYTAVKVQNTVKRQVLSQWRRSVFGASSSVSSSDAHAMDVSFLKGAKLRTERRIKRLREKLAWRLQNLAEKSAIASISSGIPQDHVVHVLEHTMHKAHVERH